MSLILDDAAATTIAMSFKPSQRKQPLKWIVKAIKYAYLLGREHEANLQGKTHVSTDGLEVTGTPQADPDGRL